MNMKETYQKPLMKMSQMKCGMMLCLSGNTDNPGGTISGGNQEPDDVLGLRNPFGTGFDEAGF